MKGNDDVVAMLNKVLYNELTAINQYFLHSRMLRNWGVTKLAKYEYEESLDEMRHADRLVERILFLEGLPNLQDLHKLRIGETVPECLGADLELERTGRAAQVEAIKACEAASDFVSRDILTAILADTETHIDFLENQIGLIAALGEPNYLQSAMGQIQTDESAVGG